VERIPLAVGDSRDDNITLVAGLSTYRPHLASYSDEMYQLDIESLKMKSQDKTSLFTN